MVRAPRCFTLAELVAVMAILLLLAGLVTAAAGRMPAFLSLRQTADEVEQLLSDARTQAMTQGVEKRVFWNAAGRTLSVDGPADARVSCRIPAAVELEWAGTPTPWLCRFFPDGGGEGHVLRLHLRGKTVQVRISPLTGLPATTAVEER